MTLFDTSLPVAHRWIRVRDAYEVTRKPRGLDIAVLPKIPFAPMEAIPQGGAFAPDYTLREPGEIRSGTYFERGDVLVAKITPSFENGKQALTTALPTDFGFATTEVIPLRPFKEGQDRRLLFFYLLHPDVRHYAAERMEGTTGRQRIPEDVLLDLPFPEFDQEEQTAIADSLEMIQQLDAVEARSIEAAQNLKRAAMHTLFTRGLRCGAQKETEIGLVPESWGQTTLGDLCNGPGGAIQTGPFGSQLHKDDYQETGVPVVNPTHLSAGRINHENVPRISDENAHRLERHRLCIDDIVLARRGQIGRMARVTKSEEGWLCGTGSFLVRARQPVVDNRFLHYQLSTEPSTRWLAAHAAGAIMPNLNNVVLRQIPILLPPVDEQNKIVAILDGIDCKIDLHRRKRAVLEELFKTLLHKLMTGEIRVGELNYSGLTVN